MLTVALIGGHGNQLAQWAFGLAQSKRLGVSLQLNSSRLGGDRPFSLHQWDIETPVTPYQIKPTVQEAGLPYDPNFANKIKNGDVISGYFQTAKYHVGIEEDLLKLNPRATDNQTLTWVGNPPTAVAVHVRRGDYLREPHKSFHGNLEWATYYKPATDYIREKVNDPKFYIFTDDPQWVKAQGWEANFSRDRFVVVEPTNEAADIYSMSMCRHIIAANSSFSWWAAYLGDLRDARRGHRTEQRVVIAPKNWFQTTSEDARDIYQPSWSRI